jgi:phosphatidylcholine synthase
MTARLIFAWLVHLYSAFGAVIAFIAILFIEQLRFQEAFFLMTLAVAIDASDGTLARAARVKELLPNFDGDRLEDIIDYFNYVVVPCLLLIRANLLPSQDALWLIAFPLLASAYGFCQKQAKTADHFFFGLSVVLECRSFISLRSKGAALGQCVFDSGAIDPCVRSD